MSGCYRIDLDNSQEGFSLIQLDYLIRMNLSFEERWLNLIIHKYAGCGWDKCSQSKSGMQALFGNLTAFTEWWIFASFTFDRLVIDMQVEVDLFWFFHIGPIKKNYVRLDVDVNRNGALVNNRSVQVIPYVLKTPPVNKNLRD